MDGAGEAGLEVGGDRHGDDRFRDLIRNLHVGVVVQGARSEILI
jgi:hypothetical protein